MSLFCYVFPLLHSQLKCQNLKWTLKHFFLNVASKLFQFIIPTCLFVFNGFIFARVLWITLKPIRVFFLCLFHSSSPFPHHRLVSTQPVKVKRKKSFNLSRKFPFYKSTENIVQELVETEREYERVTTALALSFMLHPVTVTHPGDGFWLALDLSVRKQSKLGPLWPLSCSEGGLSTSHRCEAALTLKRCARTSISVRAV